jgi:DNA (cytosine-5)-methyltransferase 1
MLENDERSTSDTLYEEVIDSSDVSSSEATLPYIVSLFSGAGGLDLGFHQEGFSIPIAIDLSSAAIKTHKRNFASTTSIAADLRALQPDGVYSLVAQNIPLGSRLGVIGGPPCQGFSRANTLSQSNDPRNDLPQLYLEIVKKLKEHYIVEFVVFENVLGIRDKKHSEKYREIIVGLDDLGFDITEKELCALDFGVPQNRKRVILSAMRKGQGYATVRPVKCEGPRTVRQAIDGLPAPAYFKRNLSIAEIPFHANHWTMQPKSKKFTDPLNSTSEGRSFKRLNWDLPSPTIAFGNREIHIHPSGDRRLSIYEAMLLQGFPNNFVLEGNLSEQVQQISNAVPPPLGRSVAAAVKTALMIREQDDL